MFVTSSLGIAKIDFEIGHVIVLTGVGKGFQDGLARESLFDNPDGIVILPSGALVVADTYNHRIRMINKTLTEVTTLAGGGEQGYRNGHCLEAKFNFPQKLCFLANKNQLFVTELNDCIRVIDMHTFQVHTLAVSVPER